MLYGTHCPPLMQTASCVTGSVVTCKASLILIIGVRLERGRVVIRTIEGIGPSVNDVALGAEDKPEIVVLVKGLAPTAFDVAPTDDQVRALALGPRIGTVPRDLRGVANKRLLLRAEQWITAIDEIVRVRRLGILTLKQSRWGDHRDGFVVHPPEFHIGFEPIIQIIVRHESGLVALVFALQVFVRVIVELRRRAGPKLGPRQELGAHDIVLRAGARSRGEWLE